MTPAAREFPVIGGSLDDGRFELLAKLGEGGMSGVFRVRDHQLGHEVALKLLLPRYLGRPEREQRIIDEGKYLERLKGHPNIIELSDRGRLRDHGWPWLTTELLHGEVLDWLLVRSKLEGSRVIDIARQVAAALEACHQCGIVHRDLTPSNLFVLEDGTVKLFDFSHAGALGSQRLAAGAPGRLTGIHDTPGTIGYMSPEQAAKAPAELAMDVFGFGALLFELITRRNPFRQFTDRDAFIRAQLEAEIEVPRIHAWAYEVPEELAVIVQDCTLRLAGERPTIAEVIERLARIGTRDRARPPAATWAPVPTSTSARGPTTRRTLLVLAMGTVVAAGGGVMLANDAEPTPVDTEIVADAADDDTARPPDPAIAQPEAPPTVSADPAPTSDPGCDEVQARCRAAFARRRWREVLEHTARNSCWSAKHERVLLRTTAMFNLGRWDECATLSSKSRDPKVRSIADACAAAARLDQLESK